MPWIHCNRYGVQNLVPLVHMGRMSLFMTMHDFTMHGGHEDTLDTLDTLDTRIEF